MKFRIEGKIILLDMFEDEDETESSFDCSTSEGWNQWGATTDRLCESQPIVEAISQALWELN